MKTRVIVVLALVTMAAVAFGLIMAQRASDASRQRSIAERNVAALADTVRRYQTDHEAAVSLMALQAKIDRDSLETLSAALALAVEDRDQVLMALSQLHVAFDALRDTITSGPVTTDPVTLDRETTFGVEGPPVDGTVSVFVPGSAGPWRMTTDLTIRPLGITYAIGCDDANSAIVTASSPSWATVTLNRGTVDPNVCHPRSTPLWTITKGKAAFGLGGVLLGVLLAHWSDDGFTKAIIP
jgi:hypothetical protein